MKRYLLALAGGLTFVILTAEIAANNGRPISVGSPGEVTCNNTMCHNSFVINTGGGVIELTTTMSNWEYVPGQTYTFQFKVKRTGNNLFGMGLEALRSTNANAGQLVITHTANTQLKSAVVGTNNRTSVVHTLNGGASADSMTFQFNWNAPATNIGNVTLYFCGVAANGSNTPVNDYVYRSTQVVTPATGSGLEDLLANAGLTILPNPARDRITLVTSQPWPRQLTVRLYDAQGRMAADLSSGFSCSGACREDFAVPSYLSGGLYFLSLESQGERAVRKIILE